MTISKKVRVLYIRNAEGRAVGRVSIPKEVLAELGFPTSATLTCLGPEHANGPAWIIEPEVGK